MKCPLMKLGEVASSFEANESDTDCLKEGCAWWHREDKTCAIVVIAISLKGLFLKGGKL